MPEEELTITLESPTETQPVSIPFHKHKGSDSPQISIKDLGNLIEVVDTVPTHTPQRLFDQIKIYISGNQHSLFVYETTNKAWIYANLS